MIQGVLVLQILGTVAEHHQEDHSKTGLPPIAKKHSS